MTEYRSPDYMKDGNEAEMWIRWSRWNKLERNVDGNQSLDDNVVSYRVVVVTKHPSVIKCGISCIVLENSVYRIMHSHLRLCLQAHVTSYSLTR